MQPYREPDGTFVHATRYRVRCSPPLVAQTADRLRASDVIVTCEGAAHVDVSTTLNTCELLSVLGTTWQRRDLQVMR